MTQDNQQKTVHYMQSPTWAHLRPETGWGVSQAHLEGLRIYAYQKKSPAGTLLYIPGFSPSKQRDLKDLIKQLAHKSHLVCKIETCDAFDQKKVEWFRAAGWLPARNVQYEYTVRLDLTKSEKELWDEMKARGRQEINYARRDGVKIEEVKPTPVNLEKMYALLEGTSQRKDFGIRRKQSVLHTWMAFAGAQQLKLVFAKHNNKVIAGGIFITDGSEKVWYKDAGSDPAFNKLFGPRLLLWETALICKKEGFKVFDLGGIPDPEHYEHSSMKGVFIFKTAFSRDFTRMMPAFELPLKPRLYPVWQKIEPSALKARRLVSKIKSRATRTGR